jgi:hypothetical protein
MSGTDDAGAAAEAEPEIGTVALFPEFSEVGARLTAPAVTVTASDARLLNPSRRSETTYSREASQARPGVGVNVTVPARSAEKVPALSATDDCTPSLNGSRSRLWLSRRFRP